MKKMIMEIAVEYSLDKYIAIHVPTQKLWNSLGEYVKKIGASWLSINCFPEYGHDTCVNFGRNYACHADISWYKENDYEIIELVGESVEDDTLTITIHSDGHKVVSASCNDITVEAKCNDTDTFNLSKGSHIALKRLIDKMNEPIKSNKIEKGDIVEILVAGDETPSQTVGLQGIVIESDSYPYVEFPIKICGCKRWSYSIEKLKLIRKASK